MIHGAGEQDLFKLGRLAGKMKITAVTFLIGGLALAGIPPLSGFWSKDEILTATLRFRPLAALLRRAADHRVDRVLYFACLATRILGR